ncbi:MAG: M14 family zinc carboxypeptidase, partial [Vicinamibacterales bacterium]
MADGIRNRTFLGVSWLAAAVVAGCSAPVPERSGATASPPASRVEPARTQPPGGELLDSERLGQTLQALSANDRVTVERIGTSAGGRPIWMAIVTAPGADLKALRRRARDISGPDVAYDRVSSARVRTRDVATALAEARLPVLVAGASWGHEAAQVEGLVGAIETLANDRSPDIERALRRTVALIVPLVNPDGRDRAVAEWKTTPRSNGESAVGNASGLMLNRDFVHQTQPESAAMLRVIRDWRPVVGIDEHEDVNRLGVAMEETAFVPPYMTGFDVEETSDGRQAITRVGDAIAKRWKAAGYPIVHDAAGDTKWVPMPPRGSGELNPVAGSSGRLEFLFNVHGIVGLITESARTPGTQTWQARVDQKRLAALAAIDAVAADPAYVATTVYERRLKATTDAA